MMLYATLRNVILMRVPSVTLSDITWKYVRPGESDEGPSETACGEADVLGSSESIRKDDRGERGH